MKFFKIDGNIYHINLLESIEKMGHEDDDDEDILQISLKDGQVFYSKNFHDLRVNLEHFLKNNQSFFDWDQTEKNAKYFKNQMEEYLKEPTCK